MAQLDQTPSDPPATSSSAEKSAAELSWEIAVHRFLTGGGRYSKATIGTYGAALRRFADIARKRGCQKPGQITALLLEKYGAALREWDPAPRTRTLHVVSVRRFVGWMRAHGADVPESHDVAQILRTEPVAVPPIVATGRPELKRLMVTEDAEPRDRAVWALAAFAGLRASEIAKLKLELFGFPF